MGSETKKELAAMATREEMIQGIVAVLERTYTTAGPTGPSASLAKFFRALDESTLRKIAYQHGVFDSAADTEADRDQEGDR